MAQKAKEMYEERLEKKLWNAADKLGINWDAAEYKLVLLGQISLKYISDAFDEPCQTLKEGKGDEEGAAPEDKDESKAEKVFYVPASARRSYLQGRAKLPTHSKDVVDAIDAIEKENSLLKDVLSLVFVQEKLDQASLGGMVDLFSAATLYPSSGGVPLRRNGFFAAGKVSEGSRGYQDLQGFCKSASIDKLRAVNYASTPGRHVGLHVEEDFHCAERFVMLKVKSVKQMKKEET